MSNNINNDSEEERIQLIGLNDRDHDNEHIAVNVEEVNGPAQRHKTRLYWIDWLRVLASFIVVFQHTTFLNFKRNYGDHNWKFLFFYNCLARHCVPLFVMISGLLFLSPKKVISMSTLYSKYIFRIFIGLVFWSFYYNVINEYVVNVHRIEFHLTVKEFQRGLYRFLTGDNSGHLWYLFFCIGLYMSTPIYKCITEKRDVAWYTAGLCFLVSQAIPTIVKMIKLLTGLEPSLITDLTRKLSFEMVGNYSSYYFLGYLLNTHEFKHKIVIKLFYVIGIIGQLLTIALRFYACNKSGKEVGDFGGYSELNVVMTAVGTFMFFKYGLGDWINRVMANSIFISKLIKKLSECSFGIYLAHMAVYDIFLRFFNFQPITFDPMIWMPIYATILFFSTATVVFLLRLIPFFRKVT